MARFSYIGRHRLGLPGLVHSQAMLTRTGHAESHNWFTRLVARSRHTGGTVVSMPVRPVYEAQRAA
jgi:hypothetical protein